MRIHKLNLPSVWYGDRNFSYETYIDYIICDMEIKLIRLKGIGGNV